MRIWDSSKPVNGLRIAQAREISGFSRSEFAAKLGISTATLRAIEQKRWSMTRQFLHVACLLTGFQVRFFFQDDPPPFPSIFKINWNCGSRFDALEAIEAGDQSARRS